MIILVTGASHTGKTALAQRLLEKYHFPYISMDHLKMGLIRSGNTTLTPSDDDKLTDYIWPIVREMIKTAIENQQNLIVEGCYVPGNWREDLTAEYLGKIRFVCLILDEKYIRDHFADVKSHACDVEKRLDDSYCTVDSLLTENAGYLEMCKANGLGYSLISEDYESAINELIDRFTSRND